MPPTSPVMDSRSLLEPLLGLPKFGNGPGLARLRALCAPIFSSTWFRDTPVIHVVGTDGKGSVSAMLATLLKGLGIRCGCYTSPHLFHFRERIVVDGEPIDDTALAASIHWVQGQLDLHYRHHPGDSVGAFEVFTAIALHHFAHRQPRVLVVESGIGGRWDCTRTLGGDLALLTSVDLEHTAILGDTREAIAADKMDILDPGGTLMISPLGSELEAFIYQRGAAQGLTIIAASDQVRWSEVHLDRSGMLLQGSLNETPIKDLRCGLSGPHQAANLALTLAGLNHWLDCHRRYQHPGQLLQVAHQVLPGLHWPGRFQRIHSSPPVYLDVAHTPQAMAMLAATVRDMALPAPILLLGVSSGRQPDTLLAPLLAEAHAVILTQAHHRGMPVHELASALGRADAIVEADQARALEWAMALARPHNRPVLVTGGLFLPAEISAQIHGHDPRELLLF